MEKKNVKPFGMKDRLSYMAGSMGCDFMFFLSSMFLLKFYTDVMGVSAALVGAMMMASRFVDAFTDMAMGQIVDKSTPKEKGKFAPFIKMIAGPVAIASFLMYPVWFQDMSMIFKVIWMFATYLLWGSVFYTAVNIPYGSMASAISDDPKERAELSNWRTIGTQVVMICVFVIMPIVVYYKNEEGQSILSGTRVTIAAAILSVLSFIFFMICYYTTTERVKFESKNREKVGLGQLFKSLAKNKALIGLVVLSLVSLLGSMSFSNMQSYIYPNYFGSANMISVTSLIGIAITLACAAFVVPLSDKFGRKGIALFAAVIQAVCFIILYVIHTESIVVWTILYEISFIGAGLFSLITWAMLTDVIDDTEVVTGQRIDATVYSIYSFSRKLAQGFSSGLAGAMLSTIGYTKETAFEPDTVNGIYNMTCIVPAISYVALALVIIFMYPLSNARVKNNAEELRRRRMAQQGQ